MYINTPRISGHDACAPRTFCHFPLSSRSLHFRYHLNVGPHYPLAFGFFYDSCHGWTVPPATGSTWTLPHCVAHHALHPCPHAARLLLSTRRRPPATVFYPITTHCRAPPTPFYPLYHTGPWTGRAAPPHDHTLPITDNLHRTAIGVEDERHIGLTRDRAFRCAATPLSLSPV